MVLLRKLKNQTNLAICRDGDRNQFAENHKKLNVTESNSSVTIRLFTYAQDPAYDEAANKPVWIGYKKEVIIMTFGEKLKEARKEAGLSQEQLAE